jgi:hypothetical protein
MRRQHGIDFRLMQFPPPPVSPRCCSAVNRSVVGYGTPTMRDNSLESFMPSFQPKRAMASRFLTDGTVKKCAQRVGSKCDASMAKNRSKLRLEIDIAVRGRRPYFSSILIMRSEER